MRLIMDCEHGTGCSEHPWGERTITDPDAILAALVSAGLLVPTGAVARQWSCANCGTDHGESGCATPDFGEVTMYVWKEAN